jgi:hypothetical protein
MYIIIVRMLNVVNNLNCVWVINKPCVQKARCMRLIPWTLRSGSKQFIYNWNWKTGKEEPGSGSRKLEADNRTDRRTTG